MKTITIDSVKALNPCADRLNNFCINNPGFKGSVEGFLSLDNITYNDKMWVCTRMMSRNQKFQFAVACATSVLDLFEAKNSSTAPRKLLEYLYTITDVNTLTETQKDEIRQVRRAAAYAAADADAAAAYAAADADAAAAYAAAYAAAAADADAAAAYAAAYAADAYAAAAAAADADAAYAAADADAAAAYAAAAAAADADAAAAYAAAYAADAYAAAAAAARQEQQEFNLIILAHVMETVE